MATILTGLFARSLSLKCGKVTSTRINSAGTSQRESPPKADGSDIIAAAPKPPARHSARCIKPPARWGLIIGLSHFHGFAPLRLAVLFYPRFYTNQSFSRLSTLQECQRD